MTTGIESALVLELGLVRKYLRSVRRGAQIIGIAGGSKYCTLLRNVPGSETLVMLEIPAGGIFGAMQCEHMKYMQTSTLLRGGSLCGVPQGVHMSNAI